MKYKISRHAQTEMERRNISQFLVQSVFYIINVKRDYRKVKNRPRLEGTVKTVC